MTYTKPAGNRMGGRGHWKTEVEMKRIRESEEMYLETILLLKQKKACVRSVDVVEALEYAKSSVSRGVNLLAKKGYLVLDQTTGNIEFTVSGREKAQAIYERHRVLTAALQKIGADARVAEEDACRIEHVISDELFTVIKAFVET